jgi:hypothetical protein
MVLVARGFRAHGLYIMVTFKMLVILHCNMSRVKRSRFTWLGLEGWPGLVKGNNKSIVGWFFL